MSTKKKQLFINKQNFLKLNQCYQLEMQLFIYLKQTFFKIIFFFRRHVILKFCSTNFCLKKVIQSSFSQPESQQLQMLKQINHSAIVF